VAYCLIKVSKGLGKDYGGHFAQIKRKSVVEGS